MRKTAMLFVMTIALGSVAIAQAQEETKPSAQQESAKAADLERRSERPKPVQPYRLDFALDELESGKKINTRHYSMTLTAGATNEMKIGTRVPVSTTSGASTQYQYLDVGTSIWANLREVGDDLQLEVRSDVSNLDLSSPRDRDLAPAPIVRQIQLNGKTLLVIGKAITLAAVDDPNSTHAFQLDVIATPMR